MRKLTFFLQTMVLGGVEKELISVLKKIHNQYDITVYLLYQDDLEILKEIPKNVKIVIAGIEKEYYCGSVVSLLIQRLKRGKIIEAIDLGIKRCLKIGMTGSNTNISGIPAYVDCDVAICYHIHSPLMLRYVVEKVNARKKIGWIHSDFYVSGYPVQRLKSYVNGYDEFVAVSKKVESEFRSVCPWYQGGISTAYNYLDAEEILSLSCEEIDDKVFFEEKEVRLLTIGRFCEEKGIDLAIKTAMLLKKEKIRFHWFLIGYGEQEGLYRQLINEYGVSDCVTILGKKTNPYPYIKNCDIYVQPSRHEAFGLVIAEAKILGKPIICTDFDGADEQINNGVNGIIVPLNDIETLYREVARLIQSPALRESLSAELNKWHPSDDLKEIVKHFE